SVFADSSTLPGESIWPQKRKSKCLFSNTRSTQKLRSFAWKAWCPVEKLKCPPCCPSLERLHFLSDIFKRQHFSFPALFIYGHTSSGKTYVMQTLLKTLELPHVFVNCIECFTSRLLLEEVLRRLQHLSSKEEAPPPPPPPCDTFNDFIRLFKQATGTPQLQDQTVYVVSMPDLPLQCELVLDNAEQLRDMEANILPGFLRLQELVSKWPK
ncbi:hypothetical protein lerEdw1_000623, partial [Lerista edwardsae]